MKCDLIICDENDKTNIFWKKIQMKSSHVFVIKMTSNKERWENISNIKNF